MSADALSSSSQHQQCGLAEQSVVSAALVQFAQQLAGELLGIWQEVGLNESEMKEQTADVCKKLQEASRERVRQEGEKRDALKREVTRAVAETRLLAEELGADLGISAPKASLRAQLDSTQKRAAELRKDKEERIKALMAMKTEVFEVYATLGEDVPAECGDVLSNLRQERLQVFQTTLAEAKLEKVKRQKEMEVAIQHCKELMKQLQIKAETDTDIAIQCDGKGLERPFSKETMQRVRDREETLSREKESRELKLQELGQQINDLWAMLKIDDNQKKSFFEKVTGVSLSSIAACESEILRLRELKVAHLASIIESLREEILLLWDQLDFPPSAREYFQAQISTPRLDFTEELLDEHRKEHQQLSKRYEAMKPLLKYVEMREALLAERDEYEESLKDPERLLNIGRDRQRLLREEKLQVRLKKDLPKINEKLLTKIPEWERENGMEFVFKGRNYLQYMREVDEEYVKKKEEERLAKKRQKAVGTLQQLDQLSPSASLTRRPSTTERTPSRTPTPGASKSTRQRSFSSRSSLSLSQGRPRTAGTNNSQSGGEDSPGKQSTSSNESFPAEDDIAA